MTVTIRSAEPRDRARLVDLLQALNSHEDTLVGDRRTDRAGAEENLDEVAQRVRESGGRFFVADLEGRVVGLLTLVFEKGPAYVREDLRSHAEIATIVVDPAARRGGVGRALMAAAEEAAAAEGYRRITLAVLAGNAAAEAAYARQGFRLRAYEMEKDLGNPGG